MGGWRLLKGRRPGGASRAQEFLGHLPDQTAAVPCQKITSKWIPLNLSHTLPTPKTGSLTNRKILQSEEKIHFTRTRLSLASKFYLY